jgi:hypothetical protein
MDQPLARWRPYLVWAAGLALVLGACGPAAQPSPTEAPLPTATPSSDADPTASSPASSEATGLDLPAGLRLLEHRLVRAPDLDPLIFLPQEGTQAEVLARHADDRARGFPDRSFLDGNNPAVWAPWEAGRLVAVVTEMEGAAPLQSVQVRYGDSVLLTEPAGLPSPALPLQGLWTYPGHWALEILLSTPEAWVGLVFIDGQSLNEVHGYEESFGFQLLSDKPFYFYQRDGQIGLSYDGQETDLAYSGIPHYQCCSGAALNPQPARDMVSFFAQREEAWYYVEVVADS